MRNYKSLTFFNTATARAGLFRGFALLSMLMLAGLFFPGCDKKSEGNPLCQSIILDKPFLAKIGETFCLPAQNWEITFGPFLEDSRCNVPGLDCLWQGQYVMGITIDHEGITRDTFYADGDWRDTLYNAGYTIILDKVYPETRTDMIPLDTSAYSFDIIVK
jgi:hypothetical protein